MSFYKSFVTLFDCKFGFVILKYGLQVELSLVYKSKTINQKFKILNSFTLSCLIQNFALPL